MKHLSVRVPWHDHYWDGTFCQHPSCNTFCQALPKIAMAKSDAEDARACQAWGTLQQDQRPACAGENGGFMCDKPHTRVFRHVYARPGNRHAALLPTPVNIPPYAAQGVPFRYMSKDYQPTLRERHPEFSDDEEAPFTSSWIYGEHRQHDILSWFRSQVATHESLCVFYCKHGTPVDDDCQRLIVGLGEVTKVHPLLEYESTQDFTYPLWELVFEHTIRRDLTASKGFLLPYHQYLELDEEEIKRQTGLSKEEALARRNSNLFDFSVRREKAQIPYVEGLIHSTKPDSQGKVVYVRSKSEVIIANELISAGIPFAYEKLLEVDGRRCIPDFTFASDDGDTILWEHLGLLDVPEYREAWEKKLAFYQQLGFVEGETLFTTRDHPHGAFTTQDVLAMIEKLKDVML